MDIGGVQYCDIFGPLEKQIKVVKILRKVNHYRTSLVHFNAQYDMDISISINTLEEVANCCWITRLF